MLFTMPHRSRSQRALSRGARRGSGLSLGVLGTVDLVLTRVSRVHGDFCFFPFTLKPSPPTIYSGQDSARVSHADSCRPRTFT